MNSVSKNQCPVCGFDLGFRPWDGNLPSEEICPSCGIQFGYDDAAGGQSQLRESIYEERRRQWINDGMPWCSAGRAQPNNWDPKVQLKRLGAEPNS